MIKEERELRKYCNDIGSRGDIPSVIQQAVISESIRALVRACYEDCAKFADSVHDTAGVGKQIAEGIRGKR